MVAPPSKLLLDGCSAGGSSKCKQAGSNQEATRSHNQVIQSVILASNTTPISFPFLNTHTVNNVLGKRSQCDRCNADGADGVRTLRVSLDLT